MPADSDLILRGHLRILTPPAALVRVPEAFFTANPIETQVVLASVRDASELLRRLLDGGHSVVAGRLAGALRHIGRPDAADEIVNTMRTASYDARESDSFGDHAPRVAAAPAAPIVGRMQAMWESIRGKVLDVFPPTPGLPVTGKRFCNSSMTSNQADAYHSLSIEGYTVSVALVERVREGNWDPDHHDEDRQSRDALAARGYWQAFQIVKAKVAGDGKRKISCGACHL